MSRMLVSVALSAVALPAFAAGGFECRTTSDTEKIVIGGCISYHPTGSICNDVYYERNGSVQMLARERVAQHWFDDTEFYLFVADERYEFPTFVLKTRATEPGGYIFEGQVTVYGADHSRKSFPVTCDYE